MKVKVSSVLEASPENVFPLLQKISILQQVSAPLVSFKPVKRIDDEWKVGKEYEFYLYLLGIPLGKHTIRLKDIDAKNRILISEESGTIAKVWNHRIELQEYEGKTLYTDEVDIHAGFLTFFVWVFANIFYRHRQRNWKSKDIL
ncbi:MAG: hypothetical protein R6V53_02710 [Candidatus Woesearchaeota archaeon]